LWIGDPAEIKTKRVRKQKTDREDARLMLKLLLENRFPRIWVPSPENRDLRQLLWHRHRLVQMRTRIMNQLQAVAMNEGYRWKKKLFSQQGRALLEKLSLAPRASRRRKELLELLGQLDPKIAELTAAVEQKANPQPLAHNSVRYCERHLTIQRLRHEPKNAKGKAPGSVGWLYGEGFESSRGRQPGTLNALALERERRAKKS
jgi:hypothetical protein